LGCRSTRATLYDDGDARRMSGSGTRHAGGS
jgi:hypothetical protein